MVPVVQKAVMAARHTTIEFTRPLTVVLHRSVRVLWVVPPRMIKNPRRLLTTMTAPRNRRQQMEALLWWHAKIAGLP